MPKNQNTTIKDLLKAFAKELIPLAKGQDKSDALTLEEKTDILIEKYLGE